MICMNFSVLLLIILVVLVLVLIVLIAIINSFNKKRAMKKGLKKSMTKIING